MPGSEIAYMQEFKKSEAKQRLFNDFNAGKVRFIIGSSDTMGTGVNVQLRLKALHHLDVPWLPSQIEQREGRIVRQGNQHDEVDIFAYATLGSLDATMWQNNERKARFIAAALSGDISVRRLEDLGEGQANQFAMAKAIASGDPRLMQKAGLEAEIARLERLRAAHIDDQHAIRRQIRDAEREIERATRRISEIGQDIERFVPTAGEAFAMTVMGSAFAERKLAGRALMQEVLALLQLQHEKETVIASIGGFDLVFVGQRLGRDGHQLGRPCVRREPVRGARNRACHGGDAARRPRFAFDHAMSCRQARASMPSAALPRRGNKTSAISYGERVGGLPPGWLPSAVITSDECWHTLGINRTAR